MNNPSISDNGSPLPELQTATTAKTNTALIVGAIAILVGMGIGILGASMLGVGTPSPANNTTNTITATEQENDASNPAALATDTKAADFRVLLTTLYREHVSMVLTAARRNLQGDPDYQASYVTLSQNASALSAALGSIYGPDAEGRFMTIWTRQNEYIINYAVAIKSGKSEAKNTAANDLNKYVTDIAILYNELNPNLPKEGIQSLVTAEVAALRIAIDAYEAKDYAASYLREQEAANQTINVANTLSSSIVQQYPEKF